MKQYGVFDPKTSLEGNRRTDGLPHVDPAVIGIAVNYRRVGRITQ